MNEDKPYEPKKIEIEVGRDANPMTITDGIIQFLGNRYGHDGFCMTIVEEIIMYEDIRRRGSVERT